MGFSAPMFQCHSLAERFKWWWVQALVEGNEEGKNRCSERFYMDFVARETILLAAEITHVCQTGKSKQGKAENIYAY